MAIFCGLCAQPGINLPEDWREYENRYVYDIAAWKLPTFVSAKTFLCEAL